MANRIEEATDYSEVVASGLVLASTIAMGVSAFVDDIPFTIGFGFLSLMLLLRTLSIRIDLTAETQE